MQVVKNDKLGITLEFPDDITLGQLEAYESNTNKVFADVKEAGQAVTDSVYFRAVLAGLHAAKFCKIEGVDLSDASKVGAKASIWIAEKVSKFIAGLKADDPN